MKDEPSQLSLEVGELAERTGSRCGPCTTTRGSVSSSLRIERDRAIDSTRPKTSYGYRRSGPSVARLEHVTGRLRDGASVDVEALVQTIEVMTMWEKSVTASQRAEVHERASELGRDQVRAVEQEWVQIIAKLRVVMAAGTDPKDERVQALVKRNRELIRAFAGENAGIETTVREVYRAGAGAEHGVDADLREFLERAAR